MINKPLNLTQRRELLKQPRTFVIIKPLAYKPTWEELVQLIH